ncbi:retrovirus-related pol polyprotein from transposon TNT 1-94 [Tanacetum coccineum]
MNMGQDRHMQMVEGDGRNQFRQYARQNVGNQNGYNAVQNVRNQVVQNAVQNPGIQNVRNQNGLIVVLRIANRNPNGNGNVVAARAEGNANGNNGNQIRCYNCRGLGHLARSCIVRPRRRDVSYFQTAADLDEIKEVNANCILMANMQQASTSSTQTDKAHVYDSDGSAESREELYFPNTSKTANVSQSISIPNEEFSDDTTPSIVQKFLNEVKSTIVTLQYVVKQKITLDIHNWSSSAHQEIHKIVKDEILPIVNQVDARVQNFEIKFLKEVTKFFLDFKSLTKEADESLSKHKALELEIERLLTAVVSQDIISIMQSNSVIDTSNLQTELDHMKERFENCIIKKENEYAKLWNDWYKKCEECKYDKISYDKAYNDMQQKIERLQAQLGDQKGKSKDTPYVSNTLDPLSQKLENENVELEFQVSEQKDTTHGTSTNTKFAKQSILGKPPSSSRPKLYDVTPLPKSKAIPKIDESHALINPFKASRVDNLVPNKHVKESVRTKPITVLQPYVIIKNDVNSKTNGFSPKDVKSTTRTRRPRSRNNLKSDKVPFKSKSSCLSNKLEKIEETHRSLQSSNYPDHTSSEYNNIKLAIRNEKYEVICATCKQCLITTNHDECVLQYVNGMKYTKKNQSANVSNVENQKKHKPKVRKPKKVRSKERLASPKPSTPRSCLRWSPTRRIFDLNGKTIATGEPVCQSDCFKGDNACTSNPQEPINKWFPSSTFSMTRCQNWLDTLLIPLLSEYKPKDKEHHGDNECDI